MTQLNPTGTTAAGAWADGNDKWPAPPPSLPPAAEKASDAAAPSVGDFAERAFSAKHTWREGTFPLRQTGDAWAQSLRGTIRSNPLSAIAGAFALGALLARMIR